ncbi:hypothetical protein OS187_03955 [Xanthomonadaceae bacterium JHOS43]|nr:hypothetical protein [Xanthomonadaceae bacterium JHOS43]MCX7562076.1 hypothetical protein [Xanthomonadaceae bacterium XH05]
MATLPVDAVAALTAEASAGGDVPVAYSVWTPDTCFVDADGTPSLLVVHGDSGTLCGITAARQGGADGASPAGTTAAAPSQHRLVRIQGDAIFSDEFESPPPI